MNDEQIIKCLRVLTALQPGNKLTLRNGIFEIDTHPNPFWRWVNGDTRATTLCFITTILRESLKSGSREVHEILFQIPNGLENLKMTYMKDQVACHSIDYICSQIKSFMT